MATTSTRMRARLDGFGIILSGLCAVHCVVGIIAVAGLGLGSGLLLAPEMHRVGLVLATIVAAAAIGLGAVRHRRLAPLLVALGGLGCMGAALLVGHGVDEAVLTVAGVVLVAVGHLLNLRPNLPQA